MRWPWCASPTGRPSSNCWRRPPPDMPAFGALCKAAAQQGASDVIGLIYDISIEDDELARQLAAAEAPPAELPADQQFVRPIPIEIRALTVGFAAAGRFEQR